MKKKVYLWDNIDSFICSLITIVIRKNFCKWDRLHQKSYFSMCDKWTHNFCRHKKFSFHLLWSQTADVGITWVNFDCTRFVNSPRIKKNSSFKPSGYYEKVIWKRMCAAVDYIFLRTREQKLTSIFHHIYCG